MSTEIGTYEAKAKFSELLRRVQAGETFTITRNGERVADITPSKEPPKKVRRIGCMKEWFGEISDDFNEPIPDMDEYQ
jgi:prevent-host-death family protein